MVIFYELEMHVVTSSSTSFLGSPGHSESAWEHTTSSSAETRRVHIKSDMRFGGDSKLTNCSGTTNSWTVTVLQRIKFLWSTTGTRQQLQVTVELIASDTKVILEGELFCVEELEVHPGDYRTSRSIVRNQVPRSRHKSDFRNLWLHSLTLTWGHLIIISSIDPAE